MYATSCKFFRHARYEKVDDTDRAMKSMKQLLTLVQTDPGVLAKLGSLFADEDEASAFQYFLDVRVKNLVRLTNYFDSRTGITQLTSV